jgi:hypothetical protein
MPSVFSRHRALERVFNDLFPNLARKRDSGEDILDQKFHRFPVFIGLDHLFALSFGHVHWTRRRWRD